MAARIAGFFLLMLACATCKAEDGWIESGGQWFNPATPGIPHTRTKHNWGEWTWNRYQCRYVYQPYIYYTYQKVAVATAVPDVEDPYFERKLADMMAAQQRANQRLELLQQLNLSPPPAFRWAQPSTYGMSNPFFGSYGASGSTIMGHNYVTQNADFYGTGLNSDLAFQQSMQFGILSNASFDKAQGYNAANLKLALENEGRRMEFQEKRLTALGLMAQVKPEPHVSLSSTAVTPQGVGVNVQQNGGGRPAPAFALASKSCLQCHGDQLAQPLGGYRVSQHWKLTREQRKRIFEELLLTGEMPRHPSDPTKPSGKPLPISQAAEFLDPEDRAEAMRVAGGGQ